MDAEFDKEMGFEGAWSELGAKSCSYRQLSPKILSPKPFSNSWGYLYVPSILLIITLYFTFDEKRIWQSNKSSQDIMFMVAA